jgi:outer membrane protein OmpA-like peptidoglycan-associated protein/tetratricopeptide (TPR) repeat protein
MIILMQKKYFLLLVCICFFIKNIVAQEKYVTTKTAPKKAQEMFIEARKALISNDEKEAHKILEKCLAKNPTFIDAYYLQASLFNRQKKFAAAEIAFEKGIALAADYEELAIFSLAEAEKKQGKNEEAILHYQQFLATDFASESIKAEAKTNIENLQFIINAIKNPVDFNPVRLPDAINTSTAGEYFPCLTADGEAMIFTRNERRNEDFYFSQNKNGVWQPATPIKSINTNENEGAQTIAADGKTIVFTACNRPYGYGDCDLYISEFLNEKWTAPKNMGANINTKSWDSQPSLSADGQKIYFASNRPKGLGGSDIWYSEKQKDGTWTAAKNLGAPINTAKDDQFPYLHFDNATLYFSTNGRAGMGGLDFFYSRKNKQNAWQMPVNLGTPINTAAEEVAFHVALDGKTAYFAREEKANSNDGVNIDIFSFELYEKARPKLVTYVKGNVYDAKTKMPLTAKIEIFDLGSDTLFTSVMADEKGSFLVCLPQGKNYAFNANRKNYLFYSDNFSLADTNFLQKPLLLDIPLQQVEKTPILTSSQGQIVLKNIFFETGSAKLLPSSLAELNFLKTMLVENPTLRIQIDGHTDNVGNDNDNLILSNARAKAVFDFLISQKISAERLRYKGFGESNPIATNDTAEGRQINRRTAFEIW